MGSCSFLGRDSTLFMMAVWTGLREGDICTLKWNEVDLINHLITRKTRKTGAIVQIPISNQLYLNRNDYSNIFGRPL